jgi:YYY domain-containing protein
VGLFIGYIFKWWFLSVLIGLIAFPVTFYLVKKSNDRGYFFSKIVGILLIGYLSWLLGHFNFSYATIYASALLLIAASAFAFIKNKDEILGFFSEKVALVVIAEMFYLFVFLAFALYRMYQPDIVGTEKFMDFAFMNAIGRADKMPPYDPWMYGVDAAGKALHISYYYFGYVLMAIMLKLTSIPNGSAYNLALTYVVALSATGMLGLVYNLTKSYLMGFLGVAFLLLVGNLHGFIQVVQHGGFDGFNWWQSSRVIDYKGYDVTINEFPFFSFMLGDMHPHQMAIPFVLLALNIALTYIKSEDKALFGFEIDKILFMVFSGIALGSLWFLNSWDFPSYLFVLGLAILYNRYSRDDKSKEWLKDAAKAAGAIFAIGVIAYLPFTLSFKSQASGIALVYQNTKIQDYFIVWGIMLFPVLSFVTFRLFNWLSALKLHKKREVFCPRCGAEIREGKVICGNCGYSTTGDELLLGGVDLPIKKASPAALNILKFITEPDMKNTKALTPAAIALGIALLLAVYKTVYGWPHVNIVIAVVVLLMAVVLLLGMTKIEYKENQFVIILIFTALLATAGVELLRIKDVFGGAPKSETARMNTVFKFYYQAWIMLSVAAAYSVFWVRHFYLRFKNGLVSGLWNAALIALVVMGLFYPVAATNAKVGGLQGLDGTEFLSGATFEGFPYVNAQGRTQRKPVPTSGDYRALQWIKQNIKKGTPVILETTWDQYRGYNRISSFTGLPGVLGWPGHENQWRGKHGDKEIGVRHADVDTIYTTNDINLAMSLINKYKIEYVYVGALEIDRYIPTPMTEEDIKRMPERQQALVKFGQFMDLAWADNAGETKIYKVRR